MHLPHGSRTDDQQILREVEADLLQRPDAAGEGLGECRFLVGEGIGNEVRLGRVHRDVFAEAAEDLLIPLEAVQAHIRLARAAVIAFAAARDEVQRHTRPGLDVGQHVGADLDHLSRGLVAGDEGKTDADRAGEQALLQGADAAVFQLHQKPPARGRGCDFLDLDFLRSGEHGCFHGNLLSG